MVAGRSSWRASIGSAQIALPEYGSIVADSHGKQEAHPQSTPGNFYVVNGECVCCGGPHAVAPGLIGWTSGDDFEHSHSIWKKQPETAEEFEQAFAAFEASCIGGYRYAGTDPDVIERVGREYSDFPEHAPWSFQFTVLRPIRNAIGRIIVALAIRYFDSIARRRDQNE